MPTIRFIKDSQRLIIFQRVMLALPFLFVVLPKVLFYPFKELVLHVFFFGIYSSVMILTFPLFISSKLLAGHYSMFLTIYFCLCVNELFRKNKKTTALVSGSKSSITIAVQK